MVAAPFPDRNRPLAWLALTLAVLGQGRRGR